MVKNKGWIAVLRMVASIALCYISSLGMGFNPMLRNVLFALCLISSFRYPKSYLLVKEKMGMWKTYFLVLLADFFAVWFFTGIFYIEDGYEWIYNKGYFFLISICWLHFVVVYVLSFLLNGGWLFKIDLATNMNSKKRDIVWLCLFLFINILFVIAFNPAITSPDSEDCYYYSKMLGMAPVPSGHTIFYIAFMKFIFGIFDSLTFMVFIQIISFAFVFLRGAHILEAIGVRQLWSTMVLYCVGMGISSIILINTIWKDIPYCIALLWFSLSLIRLVVNEKNAISVLWHIEFIVSGTLAGMFRYNGVLVVGVTGILLLILYRKKLFVALSTLLCCFLICAVIPFYFSKYEQIDEPGLKYYALSNDIGYVYYNGGKISVEAQDIVNDLKSGDDYQFDAYYTKMGRENFNEYTVRSFFPTYLATLKDNTMIMIEGILKRTSVIWSVSLSRFESVNGVSYLGESHLIQYEGHYPHRINNFVKDWLENGIRNITNNDVIYVLYWRTGIYTLSMVFVLLLLLFRYGRSSIKYILPLLPVMFNMLSYAIASGWPDYRYYWPMMIISAFVIPYGIFIITIKNIWQYDKRSILDI